MAEHSKQCAIVIYIIKVDHTTLVHNKQHNRFLSESREKDADVIFIGDCILQSLQNVEAWNAYFAPMHCLNFSICNDQTQHTLWRLQNGELDNVKPRAVVLLIGTNNIPVHSADQISEGIMEIVRTIRAKLTDVYVVLLVRLLIVALV